MRDEDRPSYPSRPTLTRDRAWSTAQDSANSRMRAGGRIKWSRDDYNFAIKIFDGLWPQEKDYKEPDLEDVAAENTADAGEAFGS